MFAGFVWDIDPTIIKFNPWQFIGLDWAPIQLRYYGLIFASMLFIGFVLWRKQMVRGGYTDELAERFLMWGVLAVLIGSRLGHVFFYEWDYYRQHPDQIIAFWRGGLASHGATVGLVVALLGFSLKYKITMIEVFDRFSMSAAVGAAAVRLGNFFNSEIVGRVTDAPWGVKFPRYDAMTRAEPAFRHPSQLYEFFMGMFVLGALYLADRLAGGEKRPRGLLASLFLLLYFSGRFTVEFFKEYQTDLVHSQKLTMGQYLSIVPVLAGALLLVWTIKNKDREWPRPEIKETPDKKETTAKKTSGKKKGKRSVAEHPSSAHGRPI